MTTTSSTPTDGRGDAAAVRATRQLVLTAVSALLGRDTTVFDRCFAPTYRQHGFVAPDGIDGARALTGSLPDTFRYDLARAVADETHVVTHGTYRGLGPVPLVGIDLWRVEDGRIVEHWDCLVPEEATTASGHTQTDGPTAVTRPGGTAASKALVEEFLDDVVAPGRWDRLPDYFAGDALVQHNPRVRDGVAHLLADFARFAEEGTALVITRRHRTVAEGEFVFTQSEGTIGGRPAVFYDLWRVSDGRIAEHWDTYREQPDELPHGNGLF